MTGSRDWTRFLRGLVVGLIACLSWPTSYVANPEPSRDSQGVEFWLALPGNWHQFPPKLLDVSLLITANLSTSGTVSIPGLGFSAPFAVMPGAATRVALPSAAALGSSDVVETKGIHLVALNNVSVYGLNRAPTSTDAYLGLPTQSLGTEYLVLAYQNFSSLTGSQFAIVATADATSVSIIPSVTTGERPGGVPYQITLQQGQTYQLRNSDPPPSDLSGTSVIADKPIAVFTGHECARIPSEFLFCDHLIEQLPPVPAWGKQFATVPLAGRSGGDTFRFLASADGTRVNVNGQPIATLRRGRFFEQIISTPAYITADRPILVAQYANGLQFDKTTGDPFMMLIPPFERFLGNYTFTTPASHFETNVINVVAPDAAVGTIALDGVTIAREHFAPIGDSGFSGAQVPISPGLHHVAGSLPFGTLVYGFRMGESYGYPGGMARAPVGAVARIEVTPETATNPIDAEHCVTAILGDRDGKPVAKVNVDFVVIGANPTAGLAVTAENGQAEFCYRGINRGTDTIVASVGTMTDTATKVWAERMLLYGDGTNALTVDSLSGAFTLRYVVGAVPQLCSGDGAAVEAGILTITSLCREDPRDVLRAVGPGDASVTVELIDYPEVTGASPNIRRFTLTRLSDTP
jgi:IgGFc binding protein